MLALSILTGAAIFVADLLLPQGFAVSVAYVGWLLISLRSPRRRPTVAMASVATALIVAGFFVARSDGTNVPAEATSRGLAMLAVWATAALIVRGKRTEAQRARRSSRRRASLRAMGVEPDALDTLAAGYIISAQEEERSRLARELHRELAPRLTAAANELHALRGDPATAAERAQRVEGQLAELESDFRRLSHSLYPTALERLDLAEAIEAECRGFEERGGLWIDFESRDVPRMVPKEVAVCLYRVCQESLSNVAKHSKAAEARVLLEAVEDGLRLAVTDTGVGFDPETTTGNLGLLGMRERARLAKGRFEVRSKRGGGTEIVAFVPVAWTDEGLTQAARAGG
jgi:signal transduction histidine kinase